MINGIHPKRKASAAGSAPSVIEEPTSTVVRAGGGGRDVSVKRPLPKLVAMFRPWTTAEDAVMRERYAKDGPVSLAARLDRSWNAVTNRARALKLANLRRVWSKKDDARLRDLWGDMTVKSIARALNRSAIAVYERAATSGLALGVPPGGEFLSAAAVRTGFYTATLRRILRWARVKISLTMSNPKYRTKNRPAPPIDGAAT